MPILKTMAILLSMNKEYFKTQKSVLINVVYNTGLQA